MKKLLVILSAAFVLTSCAVKFPYQRYAGSIDFTQYERQGVFITESNSVNFEYTPIATVSATVTEGWEVTKGKKPDGEKYTYQELSKLKFGEYVSAHKEDALRMLVAETRKINADGVINLQFTYIPAIAGKYGSTMQPEKFIATGMAIKRK